MMRLDPAPEPATFYELVQKPGQLFLKSTPKPSESQWKTHNYWRKIAKELRQAYKGICAYYCQYVPLVTGGDTVEHFKPKNKYPQEAYIWLNYRFICNTMNGRKRISEKVLDPFQIGENWFVLDFDTLMVHSGEAIDLGQQKRVKETIDILKLNDDICVEGRIEALKQYAQSGGDMEFLSFYAPFIAHELERQGLEEIIYRRFTDLLNKKILIVVSWQP